VHSIVLNAHVNIHYSHKRDGLILINYAVAPGMASQ